jgi:gamma-glutamyltranspeptidase/glutathione hydrolase
MKGAVTSGHPLTSRAAAEMFSLGGNAFDAAVSAGFASVVVEPALTSLGGGGFLLAHIEEENKDILFDFFVNTPGKNNVKNRNPAMKAVEIKFPGSSQTFYIGPGSVAVPGMLQGLLYMHNRLCTLPLKTILAPALGYLEKGVEINETQELFLNYLEPIFTFSDYGRQIYMKNGRYVKQHDRIENPLLKQFLKRIAQNDGSLYLKEITKNLVDEMNNFDGMVLQRDIDNYRVIEREPLYIQYRDKKILTNPPPSFGGIMLALSMAFLECINFSSFTHGSENYFITLIELMRHIDSFRSMQRGDWIDRIPYPFSDQEVSPLIRAYEKGVSEKIFISTQGTTQISVVDSQGNAASMTTSNGSGSGHFIPETGSMLNNMMGEDDLHPDGFFVSPRGKRVSSMMLPTMVMKDGRVDMVLGSGGSKRIRTAILQVLTNRIDFHYSFRDAIEAPRIHWENKTVHAEPEIAEKVLERLKKLYTINVWGKQNVYFGGVHAVTGDMQGWGDSRRGGNFLRYD